MRFVLKNGRFSADAPKGYIPKYGEVLKAINEDTGDETLVMVKKDGPQGGGCAGCIAAPDRWNSDTCMHTFCGKYDFTLIDITNILEEL